MFYWIIRAISWLLLKIFWKVEVTGIENIPEKGAFIIAANHVSYLDPFFLAISMKRKICFITKKEAFNNIFVKFILNKLNAFPVDREIIDILAMKKAINILQEGKILGVFPEGSRSLNGELQKLKLGVIKLAIKTGVQIIPVGISGTYKIYPHGKVLPAFFKHKITIHYGRPLYLSKIKSKDKTYHQESLDILSNNIKQLTVI
jgi:1-acyl-sn-glycerol-3-phosphate acyltransferase